MRGDSPIALDPLLQSSLQVIVGLAAQAREFSNTLSLRAMAKLAGGDVIVGHAMPKNLLAFGGERLVPVTARLSCHRRDISSQLAIGIRLHAHRNMRHILQGKWIIPLLILKTLELVDDIVLVLPREPRRDRKALQGRPVTKGA